VKGIELVRMNREEGNQTLCVSSRPFVLCGLPVRRLPSDQLTYERRNGQFVLQITGHPQFGVPFGQDRIVPIFLATLAVRQKSPVIRFRTAAEMLKTFGMHRGGKEYRRLIAAFERFFGATMSFGTEKLAGTTRVIQHSRFNFMREAQIWIRPLSGKCHHWPEVRNDEPRPGDPVGRRAAAVETAGHAARVRLNQQSCHTSGTKRPTFY
jgi:hypothetical protein